MRVFLSIHALRSLAVPWGRVLPGLASQCTQPGSTAVGRWSSVLCQPPGAAPSSGAVLLLLSHAQCLSVPQESNEVSSPPLQLAVFKSLRKKGIYCLHLFVALNFNLEHFGSPTLRCLAQKPVSEFSLPIPSLQSVSLNHSDLICWIQIREQNQSRFCSNTNIKLEPHLFTQLCEHKFRKSESKWTGKKSELGLSPEVCCLSTCSANPRPAKVLLSSMRFVCSGVFGKSLMYSYNYKFSFCNQTCLLL